MLLSELISDRFQGKVNVRCEDTVDAKNVTMACGSWVVARQFSGWSPVSLSRDLSCANNVGLLWQGVQKLVLNRAS